MSAGRVGCEQSGLYPHNPHTLRALQAARLREEACTAQARSLLTRGAHGASRQGTISSSASASAAAAAAGKPLAPVSKPREVEKGSNLSSAFSTLYALVNIISPF